MNILKLLTTIGLTSVLTVSSTLFIQNPSYAGWSLGWEDFDPFNPDSDLIPSAITETLADTLIDFEICNERDDGGVVFYSLNGSQKSVEDGYCNTHSQYPAGTAITYDIFFDDGYQGGLYNLSDGGNYYFTKSDRGVSFYSY